MFHDGAIVLARTPKSTPRDGSLMLAGLIMPSITAKGVAWRSKCGQS